LAAPAQAVVLAEAIGALPQRAWSAVLLTLALYPAARPAGLGAIAALLASTLAGGILGHFLPGLLMLVGPMRHRGGEMYRRAGSPCGRWQTGEAVPCVPVGLPLSRGLRGPFKLKPGWQPSGTGSA